MDINYLYKTYKGADLSNYILDNNADEIKVEIYGIDKPLNSGIGSLSVASNVKFMFMDSANPEWLEWHYCTFGTYASEEDRISWCAPRGYA